MTEEIIKLLVATAIAGLVIGFLLTPRNILTEIIELIKLQPNLNTAKEILDRLSSEIQEKEEENQDLEMMVFDQQNKIEELKQRAAHIKESGELAKLSELSTQKQKLEKLKQTVSNLRGKNIHKFNVAALINLVQNLYFDLYQQEISIGEVNSMLNSSFGSNSSFGNMGITPQMNTKSSAPRI